MRKSIFSKYFTVCISIIFVGMAILGAILMLFAAQYFKEEREGLLLRNAKGAAGIISSEYTSQGNATVRKPVVSATFNVLGTSSDSILFLTDANGVTLICNEGDSCIHTADIIPRDFLEEASTGYYSELGKLGGVYASDYYTVGVPVIVEDEGVIGYVFASSSAVALKYFIAANLRMFTLSAMMVFVFSFMVLYVITRQLTQPLREMAVAAKNFGKGDFSQRIPVRRSDEIGQLAVAFNNMASSLAQNEKLRRSFVANVSHELKTPMTTIGGFIDGILDNTIPPEKHEYYLSIVSDEVKRLSVIVRSMLNLSKIEAGEMTINPSCFDINEIMCRVIFSFDRRLEEKHLEVTGLDSGKIMVNADADMMHQVVYNLVENAVKFVNDGGYISVSYRTEDGNVLVGIKNSGAGIPKDEVQSIFDRFYKTDKSRSLDKTGVGLGLYIVKTIINLHGGNIIVNSTEGEFCEFVFSVPAGTPPRERKKENPKLQGKQRS